MPNRVVKSLMLTLTAAVMVFFSALTAQPAQQDSKKTQAGVTRATKIISGEVSGIGKDFISVIYKRDTEKGTEEEMLIPLPGGVTVERKKSLEQISVGDIVDVQYEEESETGGEGVKITRKAKLVSFLRSASPAQESSVLAGQ